MFKRWLPLVLAIIAIAGVRFFTAEAQTVAAQDSPADPDSDARVLSEDADSVTVEIVYYPLNTNKYAIGENLNWKTDYAHMSQYLRPTPTENWDDKMRADLLAALQKDGIDPDHLSDKQLVTEVSHWLMQRSRTTNAF